MSGSAEHEIYKRRRGRNLAVLAVVGGFAVLVFTVTFVIYAENSRMLSQRNTTHGVIEPTGVVDAK